MAGIMYIQNDIFSVKTADENGFVGGRSRSKEKGHFGFRAYWKWKVPAYVPDTLMFPYFLPSLNALMPLCFS